MDKGQIVQEISDKQVLDLGRERDAPSSQHQDVGDIFNRNEDVQFASGYPYLPILITYQFVLSS